LAWLGSAQAWTAGLSGGPITVEVHNAGGNPATLTTALVVSLTSNSTGDNDFSLTAGGPTIPTVNILPGNAQAVIYYQDYKAGDWTLTASAPSLSLATLPVTVVPASFNKFQVLWPGQTSNFGHQSGDGNVGAPLAVMAGSGVIATINAVDTYFNILTSFIDPVTFVSSDATTPPLGSKPLAGGTTTQSVTFFSPGNQSVTVTDLSNGAFKGNGDLLTVQAGTNSTLLNIVHSAPFLSTVVLGQSSVTLLDMILKVQSGTNPIQPDTILLHARDSAGADVAIDSAFQNLYLVSGTQAITLNVGSQSSASTTFTIPASTFLISSASALGMTLVGDISPNASAKSVSLSLDNSNFIAAKDNVTGNPVGISSLGDPTGFPMGTGLMVLSAADLAKTYGNYPNPFHAGMENTTIEFYLNSASTVTLDLYDVMGSKVITLLKNQSIQPGLQRVSWDGRNGFGSLVLNGVYYAQLDVNGTKLLLKIAVVK
jgi:hypothetical protein